MPRNDGTQREAMVARKLLTVHLVSNDHVLGLTYRQAAGILGVGGWNRLFLGGARIAGFEQDLTCICIHSRSLQQRGERSPCPISCADRTKLPLRSFDLRY